MNKKNGIICLLCLVTTLNLFAQGQKQKNNIGVGIGICPDRQVWIGNPANFWAEINSSAVFQVFYARQVREAVKLGSYFEYESARFVITNDKASRYNIGLNWLAQFPNNALHAQLGGYLGYGFLTSDNWDQRMFGVDYGIMIGPAYEKDNFGIALHLQTGFGWYLSSGEPDEVDFSIPRFMLKVYYKL